MNKPLIKIYGERNTGTNYLIKLIDLNISCSLLRGSDPEALRAIQKWIPGHEFLLDIFFQLTYPANLGWKHSIVKQVDELKKTKICMKNIFFITITKNPYSWALSLFKRPYHLQYNFNIFKEPKYWLLSLFKRPYHYSAKKWTFEKFLTSRWHTTKRENAPHIFDNPITMWNRKNVSYIELNKLFPTANIKYEDLILNPEKTIDTIASKFKLTKKHSKLENFVKSTKGDAKDFSFYQKYYLEEKWRKELSKESIDIINKNIDEKLLEYYYYNKLT